MKWGVRRYQNYDGTRIGTGGDPVIRKGKAVSNAYRNSVAGGQGGKAKGTARLAATAGGAKKNKNKPDKQGALDQTIPNGKGKPNVSPAEKLARDSSNLATGGKELTRAIRDVDPRLKQKKEKAQNKQLNKAKKMSDQELRDSINRIKMEREYASLTTKETKSGYDKAMEIMEISGKVLFVVATGLSIASTIKKLKHSGVDTSEEEKVLYTFLEKNEVPNDILVHVQALDTDYLEDWLEHHGVKGMRWGVRRYQNYDGTRIGVGSGAGGGGGGSSKKANLSSTFKRSIAGGQGGKAEGTARLAAKTSSPLYKDRPKNFIDRYNNKKLKAQKDKELFGNSTDNKENIRKGVAAMKETLDKRNENIGKYNTNYYLTDKYDGEKGPKTKQMQQIYDLEGHHSEHQLVRAVVEERYAKLTVNDLDDEMISLGKEWGLAQYNKNLKPYYKNGKLTYKTRR